MSAFNQFLNVLLTYIFPIVSFYTSHFIPHFIHLSDPILCLLYIRKDRFTKDFWVFFEGIEGGHWKDMG